MCLFQRQLNTFNIAERCKLELEKRRKQQIMTFNYLNVEVTNSRNTIK